MATPIVPQIVYTADGQPMYLQTPAPTGGTVAAYQPAMPLVQQPLVLPAAYQPAVPAAVDTGRDPWPARLLCGGVGVGAAGMGAGFLLQALAAATTGLALLVGALGLIWLLKNSGSGGRSGAVNVTVTTNTRVRNR